MDRALLEDQLSRAAGAPVQITRAVPLAGGGSMETVALDVTVEGQLQSVVLRRDLAASMSASALTRAQEFALLQKTYACGVPSPRPRWCVPDVERPYFVMDRCLGESVGRRVVRLPELAHARAVLAAQMGDALAKIHAVPVDGELSFLPRPEAGETPTSRALRETRAAIEALRRDDPAWAAVLRWLDARQPAATGPSVLVHGDFRVGNLLVTPTGLSAVIDWEFSHVGDPAEDLAWAAVRDWRFEQDALPVGGVGTREQLHEAYRRAGGRAVSDEALRWWEILGNLRWAVICHAQAERHLSGRDRSVELLSLGRKSTEVLWEALDLVREAEGDPRGPAVEFAARDLHAPPGGERPTVHELLDAVREHLQQKVAPALTDAPLRFQTLVAAQVVTVVQRELARGDSATRELAAERASLPGAPSDDAALCRAVDSGAYDDPSAARALRAYLQRRTEASVALWNPSFLARVRGGTGRP